MTPCISFPEPSCVLVCTVRILTWWNTPHPLLNLLRLYVITQPLSHFVSSSSTFNSLDTFVFNKVLVLYGDVLPPLSFFILPPSSLAPSFYSNDLSWIKCNTRLSHELNSLVIRWVFRSVGVGCIFDTKDQTISFPHFFFKILRRLLVVVDMFRWCFYLVFLIFKKLTIF